MKQFLLFLGISLIAEILPAQPFQWADGFGSYWTVGNMSSTVDYDKAGNTFISGYFEGVVDFDPGPGVVTRTATNRDMYIAKFDAAGALLWVNAVDLGSTSFFGFRVSVDSAGAVLVVGAFSGTADFDPSAATFTLTAASLKDGLVAKYGANGNLAWAFLLGGSNEPAETFDVMADVSGNVYITGSFRGTVDFDPGAAVHNESTPSVGVYGTYVAKYDPAGNYLWSLAVSNTNSLVCSNRIFVAPNGECLVSGYVTGTTDFDPGPGVGQVVYTNAEKVFAVRYDASGNFMSVFAITLDVAGKGTIVKQDSNGDIYLGGTFEGTADVDPGPGTTGMVATGNSDAFLAKYTASGTLLWHLHFGAAGKITTGYSIALDMTDNVYMCGYFRDSIDVDNGPGVAQLVSDTMFDGYLVRYDPNGNYSGSLEINTSQVRDVAVDYSGFIFITGTFNTVQADFDPDAPLYTIPPVGQVDFFLAKYSSLMMQISPIQNEEADAIQIYPNPNNGTFRLDDNASGKIEIADVHGRIVFATVATPGKEIVVTGLTPGLYFLRTETGVQKFIVNE